MADVLLFHHAQGLTDGVMAFAERLRAAGHRVTLPDLYDGATYDSLEEGVAHAERMGFDEIVTRGVAAARALPADAVYGGFSLGALPAQMLAQTRPGALAALLYHGGIPASHFGDAWPADVALQVHVAEHDELGEPDVCEELVRGAAVGELYVYPGSAHLFTDASLPDHDPASAQLALERTLALLQRWP